MYSGSKLHIYVCPESTILDYDEEKKNGGGERKVIPKGYLQD
jgi:hypothetical protein